MICVVQVTFDFLIVNLPEVPRGKRCGMLQLRSVDRGGQDGLRPRTGARLSGPK